MIPGFGRSEVVIIYPEPLNPLWKMDYIMTIPKDSLNSKELDHGTGNWGQQLGWDTGTGGTGDRSHKHDDSANQNWDLAAIKYSDLTTAVV